MKKIEITKIEKVWLSTREAADYLGVTPRLVREKVSKLIRCSTPPEMKGFWFLKSDLDAYLRKYQLPN